MDDQTSAKQRRRPVTACSECHRRKQKCNRQKPCNHCTSRQKTSRCSYDETSAPLKVSRVRNQWSTTSSIRQNDNYVTPETTPEENRSVQDEIGYSSFYGSDAYSELKQLLEDDDVFRAATAITSRTQRHDPSKKFWALVAQLPPRDVQQDLIKIFFRDVHWRYITLEKVYFDDLHAQWVGLNISAAGYIDLKTVPRKLQYFPALLLQLYALTLQFVRVGTDYGSTSAITSMIQDDAACEEISWKYSDIGTEIMTLLGRHRTDIVAVQAYVLRAAFLKNFGHGIEAWYVISDAIRQAQELEFHRQTDVVQLGDDSNDIEDTLGKFWADEFQRRLWLTLFAWDSQMSFILGRPRMINTNDCNIKIPLDCAFPQNPSKTVPGLPGSMASPFSIVIFRYNLAHKIHEIRALGADKRCPVDYKIVWSLHDQIKALMDTVPLYLRPTNPDTSWDDKCPYLRVHRSELIKDVTAVLMALHLPHITTNPESRQAALEAGLACLESQQRSAEESGPQHARYFGCAFYTINACIQVSAVALMFPPQDADVRSLIDQSLSQSITRLTAIESVNLIAKSGLDIARKCHAKIQAKFTSSPQSYNSTASDHPYPTTSGSMDTGYQSQTQMVDPTTTMNQVPVGPGIDGGEFFAPFESTDFDTSYWISQVNQIPDVFGTDPTWDELFTNNL